MAKTTKDTVKVPVTKDDTDAIKETFPEKFEVKSGVADKDILQYDQEGVLLQFDEKDFRELSTEVIEQLSRDNILRYTLAERDFRELSKPGRVEATPGLAVKLDFGGGNALNRINNLGDPRYKDNPDWHPAWKRPDEIDEAKRAGYKTTGKSLNGPDGKLDMVEVVVPQERFDRHYEAVVHESKERTRRSIEGAMSEIDGIVPGEMKAINTTTGTNVRKSFDNE